MEKKAPIILLTLLITACSSGTGSSPENNFNHPVAGFNSDENPYRQISQIPLPVGYERTITDSNSFSTYLRKIGLKKNSTVYLYNGRPKQNQSAQFALLDISVGDKDLQQCADAVMRLRAEYLFAQKQFNQIIFFDNDKTAYQFSAPYTRDHFSNYLNRVFGMCGSASLTKQLNTVNNFKDIQSGGGMIRGVFHGYAAFVIEVAETNPARTI